jgi:hypothetical protein
VRRVIAPLFVLAVLAFVAFAAATMVAVNQMVNRGQQIRGGGFTIELGPWQIWAFAGWLVGCAALVVGGTLVEHRKRLDRGARSVRTRHYRGDRT